MNKKPNSSAVYDIVKNIAVILVVVAHSTRMYTSYGAFSPVNSAPWLAMLTEYIYAFHMPLFIFVSGAVYAICIQRGKYAVKTRFVINKAKRLMIPYAVFGFFYVAPSMCVMGLTQLSYAQYCWQGIVLSQDSRHLWFLWALFNIFIFAMLMRNWLLGSHKTRMAAMIVSCVVFLLAGYMPGCFQISAACSYQLYFMAGACAHFYYDKIVKLITKARYLWIIFPIALAVKFYFGLHVFDWLVDDFTGIWMIFMAAVLLAHNEKLLCARWFTVLKDYAMGIFLFHPMIIYGCYFLLSSRDIPPILMSMGTALFSLILSMLLTKAVRILKLGFLMGE